MELDIEKLEQTLSENCIFIGNKDLVFKKVNSVYESTEGEITWIKQGISEDEKLINNTKASCIICHEDTFMHYKGITTNRLFIISKTPKLEYFRLLKYVKELNAIKPLVNIHPTAIIHADCNLGNNVVIGAYSVIGACSIGDGVEIGEFVKIFDNVIIGSNTKIRENVTIGGDGFGYYKNEDNTLEHIPHIGSVSIGENVHIFPFANIDRGALSITTVGNGSVIDHYVHVSHNSRIGKNTIVCANTVLSGGSVIKDNCFIGVNTLLKEKCIIGNGALTGIGSVVIKNIPDNEVWVGSPAKFLKKNS
jgi:UDP-3-O-[3-hydroxymyristoyl] glucosamine N-acyltransferase